MDTDPNDVRAKQAPNDVTVDELGVTHHRHQMLPVWFFIGVLLLIYGVLILITGIAELGNPPNTVLSYLHPAIWWGVLLILIGGLYVYLYSPRKRRT
jgi:hypothetical protein